MEQPLEVALNDTGVPDISGEGALDVRLALWHLPGIELLEVALSCPSLLVAVTVNEYVVPGCNPLKVVVVAVGASLTVMLPGWPITVYPVIGASMARQVRAGPQLTVMLEGPLVATGSGITRGGLGSIFASFCACCM